MSVIKNKRHEGKLQAFLKANELAMYTVTICKNEKNFPKRDRWILTQPIVRECLDAIACIRRANAVRVVLPEDYAYRRSQQVEAHAHLDALLGLMDIAYNALHIDGDRMEYWTGLVLETDDLVRKWRQSDRRRHPEYAQAERTAALPAPESGDAADAAPE